MRLLKVDTLEEARKKLLTAAKEKLPEVETVPFTEGLGRILAKDIVAKVNVPDFRKSTVDGYAVRAKDVQGVTESVPVFLEVVEEIIMGAAPQKTVGPGQAAYVPTGGMLPEGADAVVMVEYCEAFDRRQIAVYDPVSPGRNVIAVGEDLQKGQAVLPKGRLIRPQEVGVLSAAGVEQVPVFRPWRVAVFSTGDELVGPQQLPQKGQTRDVNTHSLCALSRKYGFEIVDFRVLADDAALLEQAVGEAMKTSDLVVVSGGSSQGEKDHTAQVLDALSDPGVFTHGIALKPGKPTILAYDKKTETILAGLPGHPAAALLTCELLLVWLYGRLTCRRENPAVPARMARNVAAAGGKTTCLLVSLHEEEPAEDEESPFYRAEPIFGKSGLMSTLTEADGYVLMGVNQEGLKEGELVKVRLF